MKKLLLLTTKPEFLPNNGKNNQGIFGVLESIPVALPPDDQVPTGLPAKLFKITKQEGEAVLYVAECLPKNGNHQIDQETRSYFLSRLLKTALENEQQRENIEEIKIIAHAFDVMEEDGPLQEIQRVNLGLKRALEGAINPLLAPGQKTLAIGEKALNAPKESTVKVHIFAFSHQSGSSKLIDVLEDHNKVPANYRGGKVVAYLNDTLDKLNKVPDDLSDAAFFNDSFDQLSFFPVFLEVSMDESKKFQFGVVEQSADKNYNTIISSLKQRASSSLGNRQTFILFVPHDYLSERNFLPLVSSYNAFLESRETDSYWPTLFIGAKDVLDPNKQELTAADATPVDPRFKFMDSSIWFRYIAFEPKDQVLFSDRLTPVNHLLDWAFKHQLYTKAVCKEHREFNLRLLSTSYLKDPDKSQGGHANKVYPFVFHSETQMELKSRSIFADFTEEKKLKWNFLLIDDYAKSALRPSDSGNASDSKGALIESIIKQSPAYPEDTPSNHHDLIAGMEMRLTVNEAVQDFFANDASNNDGKNQTPKKNYLPDIILLDFLFSHPDLEKKKDQHYGTDLFEYIKTRKAIHNKGLLQSYWIYPISAFNEAMMSTLQEKNYQHHDADWFIARGADPINTPGLFRSTLLEFMKTQADKIIFEEKDIWQFIAENPLELTESKNPQPNRTKAIWRKFLDQFMTDEGVAGSSALHLSAKKFLRDKEHRLQLRDAIQQLYALFSISVGYDFPIIEREFKKIDNHFQRYVEHNKSTLDKDLLGRLEYAMNQLATAVYSIAFKHF